MARKRSFEEDNQKVGQKLIIPLKEDGTVDLERMRESTKQRLFQAVAGLEAQAEEDLAEQARALKAVVPAIYKVLGTIEGLVASWVTKVPREEAIRIFDYGPGEIQALSEPTANILAKHASNIAAYKDEISLALILTAIHQEKIAAIMELKKEYVQRPDSRSEKAREVNSGSSGSSSPGPNGSGVRPELSVSDVSEDIG